MTLVRRQERKFFAVVPFVVETDGCEYTVSTGRFAVER